VIHDPDFGSLANRTVGCKPDIIFAAHLAYRMPESILALAVAPTVISCLEHVKLSKRQPCKKLKSLQQQRDQISPII
jgi:hypothetical protein